MIHYDKLYESCGQSQSEVKYCLTSSKFDVFWNSTDDMHHTNYLWVGLSVRAIALRGM